MDKTIEDVKNFWNRRPCNIRHSKKELGTKEYFDEVEKRRYEVEPHIAEFANFSNWGGKKVLEIGCGIGTDTISFAKNGAYITAIDLSEKSIDITKKRFDIYGEHGEIIYADAENLSLFIEDQKFDLIYSFGVIHHTPNPSKVLNEIKKFSSKDTIIKLMFYSKYSWKGIGFFLQYGWKFKFDYEKTIKYFAEAQLNCPIANVYTKKDLEFLFQDFEIIEIKKDHIFQYRIDKYINGFLDRKFIFKIMPNFIFSYLKRTLGWHYLITLKIK